MNCRTRIVLVADSALLITAAPGLHSFAAVERSAAIEQREAAKRVT